MEHEQLDDLWCLVQNASQGTKQFIHCLSFSWFQNCSCYKYAFIVCHFTILSSYFECPWTELNGKPITHSWNPFPRSISHQSNLARKKNCQFFAGRPFGLKSKVKKPILLLAKRPKTPLWVLKRSEILGRVGSNLLNSEAIMNQINAFFAHPEVWRHEIGKHIIPT